MPDPLHRPLASFATRLRCLLLGWGSVGLAYGLSMALAARLATPTVLQESVLDRWVPFNPAGIWAYLMFFGLVPYTYAVLRAERLRRLQHAMQASALLGFAVFLAWPTTMAYPSAAGEGVCLALLRLLRVADTPHHCLPSLHGALTLLCLLALTDRQRPWHSAAVWAVGAGICVSVVQLRRHLSVDLAAGLALGWASWWGAARYGAAAWQVSLTRKVWS